MRLELSGQSYLPFTLIICKYINFSSLQKKYNRKYLVLNFMPQFHFSRQQFLITTQNNEYQTNT